MSVGRRPRFVDSKVELLAAACGLDLPAKVTDNSAQIITLLDDEKTACPSYTAAWDKATARYESHYKEEMNAHILKKINEDLPKKLPDPLKSKPTYVPISLIVCTEEESSDFFNKFKDATRTMISNDDWDSYPYKSLLILIHLAQTYLPSRPDNKSKKVVFRGLDTTQEFTVGQKFCLGYFAPFSVRRFLALGNKPNDEAGDEEDAEESEPMTPSLLTKTILKMAFTPHVLGMGVRPFSPLPDEEREVLVFPQQMFKVIDVKKRPKKGFTVVILEPEC